MKVKRRVTFKLYPTKAQQARLRDLKGAHQRLYNAAIQERRAAWDKGVSLSFVDQCKHVKTLKADLEEYKPIHTHALQVTLKRVDLAFANFFSRIKTGAIKLGYPRYKSFRRFSGWGYKQHKNGFRVFSAGHHGALRLSEVGTIKMRGRGRQWGEVKTCDILHRQGCWFASIVVECEVVREHGSGAIGLDWGLRHFATLIDQSGQVEQVANPRFLKRSASRLKAEQRSVSRKKRGSVGRGKQRRRVAALHAKIGRQREDFHHQLSARLVDENGLIASEVLNVKGMMASGGANKRGLNKSIGDAGPSGFLQKLRIKAEEAGCVFVEIETRRVKPSQTCSGCGAQKKKSLSERTHRCGVCGLVMDRDANAALVMLNVALEAKPVGREPALCGGGQPPLKHETTARARSV